MKLSFRKESIEHQQTKWVGKALLTPSAPAWLVLGLSLLFLTIFIAALTLCNYTRRINVFGEITSEPRSVNIFATQQGFISDRFVKVGDVVKKGDRLYQIDFSKVTHGGNFSIKTREAIESQLVQIEKIIDKLQKNKQLTIDNLRTQKQQYELAHSQSLSFLMDARKGAQFAKETMKNYSDYHLRGLTTKDQLSAQIYSYYQQQNSVQILSNQRIQESLQITNLATEIVTRAADFDNQISQSQLEHNSLQRQLAESDANSTRIIEAPADGRIESLSVTRGQMVNLGDSLAQLIPSTHSTYYLVLWLPNSSVPYISQGESVNIRYEAFPFEKFGQFHGQIETIAYVPASAQEMATYSNSPIGQPNRQGEAYYKVMVALTETHFRHQNKTLALSSGMKAESTLFLEKRPLYQWMFSPFYGIRKSVAGPVNG